jgi:hypothetical protein
MAKKKKETTEEVVEKVDNVTKVDLKKTEDDNVVKVDLSKPPTPKQEENETKEDNADDSGVVAEPENAEPTQEQEEVQPEVQAQETPVLEEITEEEAAEAEEIATEAEEAIKENLETGEPLPENIQKLVNFME